MLPQARVRVLALATGVLFTCLAGCSLEEETEPEMTDEVQRASSFDKSLNGRGDPIASWLRTQGVDGKGVFKSDFRTVALGIARHRGCDERTLRVFVISDDLVTGASRRTEGNDTFPRLIAAGCANDANKARDFFVAASFKQPDRNDVDVRNLELFAWDDEAGQHRFYAMKPLGSDRMKIEVEPKQCKTCHLTPNDLSSAHMPMVPIMNELRQPWTHWEASSRFPDEQSFDSHHFLLPTGLDEAPNFSALLAEFRGAATNLEDIIAASQARVVKQRLLALKLGPGLTADSKLSQAMALLRPMFCDEQVNYASEEFDSGIYQMATLVDPSLPELFRQVLGPTQVTWSWATQESFSVNGSGTPVDLIPVRGNFLALYEQRLGNPLLNPNFSVTSILRVRALDWGESALSEFRCSLWKKAETRFKTAKNRPNLASVKTVAAAMAIVFPEIMTLRIGNKKPVSLLVGDSRKQVLAVASATAEIVGNLQKALADGAVGSGAAACKRDGFCLLEHSPWGDAIEAQLDKLTESQNARKSLRGIRCRRVLEVVKRFPNRPALPLKEIFPNEPMSCP